MLYSICKYCGAQKCIYGTTECQKSRIENMKKKKVNKISIVFLSRIVYQNITEFAVYTICLITYLLFRLVFDLFQFSYY